MSGFCHNTRIEEQFLAWLSMYGQFVYVDEAYLTGERLECYLAYKAQYESSGHIDLSALPPHLIDHATKYNDSATINGHVAIVSALGREYRRRRAWATMATAVCALEKNRDPDTDNIISESVDSVMGVMAGRDDKKYDHTFSVGQYLGYVEEKRKSIGELKGVTSTMPDLDRVINGWQKGKTYAIGGLKKTGKSRFVLNLVSRWLCSGMNGIMFSMEMNETDIHSCIFGNRLNINTSKIGTSTLSDKELMLIKSESENYQRQGLIIDRRSAVKTMDVKNQIVRYKNKGKVDFVVIDYIQRMTGEGDKRSAQIESCATRLADIGRDENVIMIILSQLSGAAEHKTSSPIYSFFKESQAIIEACDCALVLSDELRGQEKNLDGHIVKCTVLQRDGVSDYTIDLFAELKYARFANVSKEQRDEQISRDFNLE